MSRNKILKYIAIIILVKIVGFGLFFLYSVENVEKKPLHKKLEIKPMKSISVVQKKTPSPKELQEEKNNVIRWKLEEKMKRVYLAVQKSYDKTKKKKANLEALKKTLTMHSDTNIFLANFFEETLYGSNDYKDINARTIVLEEIQKVRRRGEGYIVSDLDDRGLKRYVLVKDLGFLNLYIGINIIE